MVFFLKNLNSKFDHSSKMNSLLEICIHVIAKNLHTFQVIFWLFQKLSYADSNYLTFLCVQQSLDILPLDIQQQIFEKRSAEYSCSFLKHSKVYLLNYLKFSRKNDSLTDGDLPVLISSTIEVFNVKIHTRFSNISFKMIWSAVMI